MNDIRHRIELVSEDGPIYAAEVPYNDEIEITRLMGFLQANSEYEFDKSDVSELHGAAKLVAFYIGDIVSEKMLKAPPLIGVAYIRMFEPADYARVKKGVHERYKDTVDFKATMGLFSQLKEKHPYLQWFVVNKKFRGKGYGRIMINHLIGLIRRKYVNSKFFSTCIKEEHLEESDAKSLQKIFYEFDFMPLGKIPSGKRFFDHVYYIRTLRA